MAKKSLKTEFQSYVTRLRHASLQEALQTTAEIAQLPQAAQQAIARQYDTQRTKEWLEVAASPIYEATLKSVEKSAAGGGSSRQMFEMLWPLDNSLADIETARNILRIRGDKTGPFMKALVKEASQMTEQQSNSGTAQLLLRFKLAARVAQEKQARKKTGKPAAGIALL